MRGLIVIIILIILAGASVVFFTSEPENVQEPRPANSGGSNSNSEPRPEPRYEPLEDLQVELIEEVVSNSEFIADIPEDNPISIEFFYFDEGQRVWQDEFILADGSIQESGDPLIDLTMHSKYIDNLENGDNICDIVKAANENRDLGFDSKLSESKLAWEYKGLIQHKECFGL